MFHFSRSQRVQAHEELLSRGKRSLCLGRGDHHLQLLVLLTQEANLVDVKFSAAQTLLVGLNLAVLRQFWLVDSRSFKAAPMTVPAKLEHELQIKPVSLFQSILIHLVRASEDI